METVFDILLAGFVVASTLSNFFGLPGNLLIALGSLFYGITTGFHQINLPFVLTLFIIVLLSEVLEFLLIAFTARKYGSSKWGVSGAIVGGVTGALSGAFFSPVMGAIIGSFIGVFIGTFSVQFLREPNVRKGLYAALGAFLGRLGGLTMKVTGAVTMASMIFIKLI